MPSALRALIAPPVLAIQLLTAVPLPLSVPAGARELGRSLVFFPLVGALLGLVLAALDAVLMRAVPVALSTALVLLAGTLLTGGLHLDGLMDTCDGVFGGRTRERRLEIMRDSRVGAYGVLAGVLQLLLKYAALVSLPVEVRGVALVAALTSGRWVMTLAIWAFSYAREAGLGRAFKDGARGSHLALAGLPALGICWAAMDVRGVAMLAGAGATAWVGGWWLSRRLGGLTGDCYGALNELVEAGVLTVAVAMAVSR